jgi:hypothetical protein
MSDTGTMTINLNGLNSNVKRPNDTTANFASPNIFDIINPKVKAITKVKANGRILTNFDAKRKLFLGVRSQLANAYKRELADFRITSLKSISDNKIIDIHSKVESSAYDCTHQTFDINFLEILKGLEVDLKGKREDIIKQSADTTRQSAGGEKFSNFLSVEINLSKLENMQKSDIAAMIKTGLDKSTSYKHVIFYNTLIKTAVKHKKITSAKYKYLRSQINIKAGSLLTKELKKDTDTFSYKSSLEFLDTTKQLEKFFKANKHNYTAATHSFKRRFGRQYPSIIKAIAMVENAYKDHMNKIMDKFNQAVEAATANKDKRLIKDRFNEVVNAYKMNMCLLCNGGIFESDHITLMDCNDRLREAFLKILEENKREYKVDANIMVEIKSVNDISTTLHSKHKEQEPVANKLISLGYIENPVEKKKKAEKEKNEQMSAKKKPRELSSANSSYANAIDQNRRENTQLIQTAQAKVAGQAIAHYAVEMVNNELVKGANHLEHVYGLTPAPTMDPPHKKDENTTKNTSATKEDKHKPTFIESKRSSQEIKPDKEYNSQPEEKITKTTSVTHNDDTVIQGGLSDNNKNNTSIDLTTPYMHIPEEETEKNPQPNVSKDTENSADKNINGNEGLELQHNIEFGEVPDDTTLSPASQESIA